MSARAPTSAPRSVSLASSVSGDETVATTGSPAFYLAGAYGLDDSWAYLMRQVLSASLRQVADALPQPDLPSVQWMPLLRLAAGQRCTVVALARDLGVDAATMTRAVDKLVAKGWVQRQRCDTDRRQVALHITPAGQAVAQQLQPTLTQVLNAPLAGFSHADWQQLLGLLRRMSAAHAQMGHAGQMGQASQATQLHADAARTGVASAPAPAPCGSPSPVSSKANTKAKTKAQTKAQINAKTKANTTAKVKHVETLVDGGIDANPRKMKRKLLDTG